MDVKMNSNRTTKRIELFMVDLDCVFERTALQQISN
jgi:hypothetical protein